MGLDQALLVRGPGIPRGPPLLHMRVVQPLAPQDRALLVLRGGVVLGHDPQLVLRAEGATLRPGSGIGPGILAGHEGVVLLSVPSQANPAKPDVSPKADREGMRCVLGWRP